MPVPLPPDDATDLEPPDAAEVSMVSRGILAAATLDLPPLSTLELAETLAARNEAYRTTGRELAATRGDPYEGFGASSPVDIA